VGASGGTGGDDGAVKAGLGDNVNLDSRVTLGMLATKLDKHTGLQTYPRVVDGAGVDLGDGHGEGLLLRKSIGELGSRKVQGRRYRRRPDARAAMSGRG
jgi:hypothetical protein